ncbi:MAG: hypothetical protein M9892_04620 [Bacteroidetes bacterium]|nr:hypothetical protein [Bacteroidota bacterium]
MLLLPLLPLHTAHFLTSSSAPPPAARAASYIPAPACTIGCPAGFRGQS